MAVANRAAEFAVTGTATSLTSLLGLSAQVHFRTLALRANVNNAGDIYVGSSSALTVAANRGGFLHPDDGLTIDMSNGLTSTDFFYFIAQSPGDILHVLRLE